jgi:hypothetical protein
VDVKLRVTPCHFRQHGSEVSRAESKRHSDSQSTAKITLRQDRLSGCIDFSAGPGCMVSKRETGFRESSAAGGSCQKLHA